MERDEFSKIKPDPSIGAVLCGFDLFISMPDCSFWYTLLSYMIRLQEARQGFLVHER